MFNEADVQSFGCLFYGCILTLMGVGAVIGFLVGHYWR